MKMKTDINHYQYFEGSLRWQAAMETLIYKNTWKSPLGSVYTFTDGGDSDRLQAFNKRFEELIKEA